MQKQSELVRLSTRDVSKAFPVTTSLIVSEQFQKGHKIVLRDIRKLEGDLRESLAKENFNGYKIAPLEYRDKKGESRPYYNMNEEFFMMLVMGYNTKKAFAIKDIFIKQFKFMKHELTVRMGTRHIGVVSRLMITDAINDNIPEGTFKNFAYSNYTRLVYKKILGMSVNKYKDRNKIDRKENIRDYFDIPTLEKIHNIESKIAGIIEFSKETDPKKLYEEIKEFLDDYKELR